MFHLLFISLLAACGPQPSVGEPAPARDALLAPIVGCAGLRWGQDQSIVRRALLDVGVTPAVAAAGPDASRWTYPWQGGQVTLDFRGSEPWHRCIWSFHEGVSADSSEALRVRLVHDLGPFESQRSSRETAWESGSTEASLLIRSGEQGFNMLERWEDPTPERFPSDWHGSMPSVVRVGDPWPQGRSALLAAGWGLLPERSSSKQKTGHSKVVQGIDVYRQGESTLQVAWRRGRVSAVELEQADQDEATVLARWDVLRPVLGAPDRDRQERWWGWSLPAGTVELSLDQDLASGAGRLRLQARPRGAAAAP